MDWSWLCSIGLSSLLLIGDPKLFLSFVLPSFHLCPLHYLRLRAYWAVDSYFYFLAFSSILQIRLASPGRRRLINLSRRKFWSCIILFFVIHQCALWVYIVYYLIHYWATINLAIILPLFSSSPDSLHRIWLVILLVIQVLH